MQVTVERLETERATAVARAASLERQLTGVRAAVAALRDVDDQPPRRSAPRVGPSRVASVAVSTNDSRVSRARHALAGGPLMVGPFLNRSKLTKYQARDLVRAGVILATGATRTRQYAWPAETSAKEAP